MKQVRKNILLIISIFVLCLGSSFVLSKQRTVETVEKHLNTDVQYHFLSYYNEYIQNDINFSNYDITIQSYEKLEKNSDYIVRVRVVNQSFLLSNFFTRVEVLTTYKGEMKQQEITLIHPDVIIDYEDHVGINLPQTWLLPMKENEEYLLYLNKEETYGSDDLFQYTTIPYSIIPIRSTIQVGLLDNQDRHTLTLKQNTIQQLDICFPINTKIQTMDDNEKDVAFVKENYLNILQQSYQKYLQMNFQYEEKVIQSEL